MLTRCSSCVVQLVLALAVAAAFTAGCSPRTSDRSLVFLNASEAMDAVQGEWRLLGSPTEGIWLDPRTEQEYREGHIPGAISMPLDRIRRDHEQLWAYDVIVVYGNTYNSPRATAASKTLMALGHGDVRTLRGGFETWKDAGHPVESDG